jgi:hypothetical protein
MIVIHPILMTVTADAGVGETATGASCGFSPDVRFADTGRRGVGFPDTGCRDTGARSRDTGGRVTQRPVTVREGLPALDRAVQLGAEHVPAAAEPVGTPADAAGLLAVEEAGLLQLGDQLAGLLPTAAQLLGELRGVGVDDEPGAVVAGHADEGEQRREQPDAEGLLQLQGGLGHHGDLQPAAGGEPVGGVRRDGLGDLEDERRPGGCGRAVPRARGSGVGRHRRLSGRRARVTAGADTSVLREQRRHPGRTTASLVVVDSAGSQSPSGVRGISLGLVPRFVSGECQLTTSLSGRRRPALTRRR